MHDFATIVDACALFSNFTRFYPIFTIITFIIDGPGTPAGSVTDTPTYMPPPPDTPGSMASTPNFSNLPQPGLHVQNMQNMQHAQWNEAFQHKKPRTDY